MLIRAPGSLWRLLAPFLFLGGDIMKRFITKVAAFIIGVFLGRTGVEVIEIIYPRCPVCQRTIRRGTQQCPHCSVGIKWGR